ncbi:MAG: S8 family serine peptidase [Pseudomonadota bacterium]
MTKVFEENTLRVSPKLRLVANCDQQVNAIRAEHAASLRVSTKALAEQASVRVVRGEKPVSGSTQDLLEANDKKSLAAARGSLSGLAAGVEANIFITLTEDKNLTLRSQPFAGVDVRDYKQRGRAATATVRLDQLDKLAANPVVAHLGLGDTLKYPDVPLGEVSNRATDPVARVPAAKRRKGKHRVLIGIVDVGGFDFAHEDFIAGGQTRFVRIWDMGAVGRAPAGFDYGHELTRDEMNAAMREAPAVGVGAHDLEPQSQRSRHSHATHVASIAAGRKSGVAKGFDIAGVLLSLPDADFERRLSFYDSTRIAHAVDYLFQLAATESYDAVSINISLGTNGHAHDGSAPICRWIDSALSEPGRCVSVAAGNAGQHEPQFDGDLGYVMGRIHTSGRIDANGLEQFVYWQVVGNGIEDVSENELEIWYPPQDRFAIQLKPPGGDWLAVVEPGQYLENQMLDDGSFYSIYNDLYHEDNGHNTLSVFLTPFLSKVVKGVPAGVWTVRLIGRDIRDGRYHGWIERDDPRRVGRTGEREYWRFPSFFTRTSNVDSSSINTLACGNSVIGVGNCVDAENTVNITSSQGPTRDGREKPDICAPGTDILAASGFDAGDRYVEMSGTSMASPYVAGVAALMLSHEPKLSAAQICGILRRTAYPLPLRNYAWQNDAGFGKIRIERCIEEARQVLERKDLRA